ncbi:uncharacterized protein SOCEGT47_038970 [Sorangium cellulosum]|uniref:Uncharacterized protein n=1 Tax=Sorangium cellulosum TaxID=56 RepID=A0A4V0NDP3_SORCE|nr:uncharacterized protein SOCEGT47_038970 [Sorangium cellulosum]
MSGRQPDGRAGVAKGGRERVVVLDRDRDGLRVGRGVGANGVEPWRGEIGGGHAKGYARG